MDKVPTSVGMQCHLDLLKTRLGDTLLKAGGCGDLLHSSCNGGETSAKNQTKLKQRCGLKELKTLNLLQRGGFSAKSTR